MSAIAFFDLDRTLVACNSGALWARYLRRRGEMSLLEFARTLGWLVQYKLAVLDMESVTARLSAQLTGLPEAELVNQCLQFTRDEVLPCVTQRARDTVERHRARGDVLAILSSSSPYVTEPVARHLDIAHVLCTRLEVSSDGRFVGRHLRPACYGEGKVHWAARFAVERGVSLDDCAFYTDSYSDLPMLERVGHKVVVNPDARLRRHAKRLGWAVEEW
jgi:HAD superfamily hydrolase (TIGR01490 family)